MNSKNIGVQILVSRPVGEKTKNFTDKFEKNKTLVLPKTQYVDIFQIMEINQQLNLNPQYYQVMDSRFIMNFQNQNVNIIDKYIDLSLNKSDLLYSQRLILSLNVKQFLTYIDGSAKIIGTDKAESIFGFSTFDLNSTFILDQF
ncbi:unnamed protein product [Rhizophagus irregularis]|nr:unnamed protein product [Rhizophagus irregularis]